MEGTENSSLRFPPYGRSVAATRRKGCRQIGYVRDKGLLSLSDVSDAGHGGADCDVHLNSPLELFKMNCV